MEITKKTTNEELVKDLIFRYCYPVRKNMNGDINIANFVEKMSDYVEHYILVNVFSENYKEVLQNHYKKITGVKNLASFTVNKACVMFVEMLKKELAKNADFYYLCFSDEFSDNGEYFLSKKTRGCKNEL